MVHMMTGQLPWKDLINTKPQDQLETLIKMRNPKTLCNGLPRELSQYIFDIQRLKATDKIKYGYFKNLLMKLFRMQFYGDDYRYDWVIQF